MSNKLQFGIKRNELMTLTESDLEAIATIQRQLGVTPRGSIRSDDVKKVTLYKESSSTRLGIIFWQSNPLVGDVTSDATPRGAAAGKQPVVFA